jgi:hypothetical protein
MTDVACVALNLKYEAGDIAEERPDILDCDHVRRLPARLQYLLA